MIKLDMARAVAEAAHITQTRAEDAVEELLSTIKDSLAAGHRIEIRGFGVLFARPLKRGVGRNPKTGELTPIPPGHRTVRFKPGKSLQNLPRETSRLRVG